MGIFKKSNSMTETERALYDARINKLTVERDQYRMEYEMSKFFREQYEELCKVTKEQKAKLDGLINIEKQLIAEVEDILSALKKQTTTE